MTKVNPKAKINKLEEAQTKIAAELELAREQEEEEEEERGRDSRRKILIGEAVMDAAMKDPKLKTLVDNLLNTWLDKARDRGLFDLPARSATQ